MPLELSVSCPGELGDSLPAIERLKDWLWREENCCVESSAWTHGFVVRLQEQSLETVRALLVASGCTVERTTEQQYAWPTSEHNTQQVWHYREPWNQSHVVVDHVIEPIPEPKIQPERAPVIGDPEPVILPFPVAA